MGADVVTLLPKILTALYKHPLTDNGLAAFLDDWQKTGQSILYDHGQQNATARRLIPILWRFGRGSLTNWPHCFPTIPL